MSAGHESRASGQGMRAGHEGRAGEPIGQRHTMCLQTRNLLMLGYSKS